MRAVPHLDKSVSLLRSWVLNLEGVRGLAYLLRVRSAHETGFA